MLLDPLFRRIVRQGELFITDASGKVHQYGTPDPNRAPVRLTFNDTRVPLDVVRRPVLGFPEAYMDGRIDIEGDDILAFVDLFRFNARWETRSTTGSASASIRG